MVILAVIAAVAMEPVAALLHRSVMHGRGWGWHRDHHAADGGRWERNDLFPVVFAGITIGVMAIGATWASLTPLLWVGAGVAAYGAAYLVVHDVCIHGRAGRPIEWSPYLRWLRDAHRVHHLRGGAPYGFLAPVVPRRFRSRDTDHFSDDGAGRSSVAPTVNSLRAVDTRARRVNTS